MNLADIRNEYMFQKLSVNDVAETPFQQFEKWMKEAINAQVLEATAIQLSTVDKNGQPSVRVVLLKGIESNGFIFYTNYEGRKGNDIDQNPLVSFNMYWRELQRQIIVEGRAEKLSFEASEKYFKSRPRGAQIGAWASKQSQVIPNRAWLEEREKALEEQYQDQEIPCPPHWGGYLIKPQKVEFWQGRPNRLHDRIVFELVNENNWKTQRLCP